MYDAFYCNFSKAGTDSRIALSIMIGLILERPEVQRKIHAELDDVLGTY